MNSIVVNGVTYTSDGDIDISDVPQKVADIYDDYLARNPHDKRHLDDAITGVHLGACRDDGTEEDWGYATGHAHGKSMCIDPVTRYEARDFSSVLRHEMAHCISGFDHSDERWPLMLRLVCSGVDADKWQAHLDAVRDGRSPLECPAGHVWDLLEPNLWSGPYAYRCYECGHEYDADGEDEYITADVVEERKRLAADADIYWLVNSEWMEVEGPDGIVFLAGGDARLVIYGLLQWVERDSTEALEWVERDSTESLERVKDVELEP